MVAILAGGELGSFYNTTLKSGASDSGVNDQIFINATTGNLVIRDMDENLVGQGIDTNVFRTYNSFGQYDGDNGDNWQIGFYRKIDVSSYQANVSVVRVNSDGSRSLYKFVGNNTYETTDGEGAYDQLVRNTNGSWLWRDGNGSTEENYDASGKLVSAVDANGKTLSFVYDSGTGLLTEANDASLNQTLLFDYDFSSRQLKNISTVSEGVTRIRTSYAYDTNDRLEYVRLDLTPDNTNDSEVFETQYAYEGSSLRVSDITTNSGRSIHFTYDVDGRVKTYKVGNDAPITMDYVTEVQAAVAANEYSQPYPYLDSATIDSRSPVTETVPVTIANSQTGGTPSLNAGSEFRANTLTSGDQRYPSSATLSDGTTIVLWEGYDGAWFGGKMRIYGQHFSADGSKLGSEFIAAQNASKNLKGVSVTALQGGGFATSWASDDNNTYIKYFNNATTPAATTGELMLHASSAGTSRNNTSIATLSNGNVVAVWQSTSQDGSGAGIYGNVLTASGSFVGSEFRLNTTTSGNQEIPEVSALADGGFIVTWQSANQDGSGLGIYAQRYNAAGFEQGGEFRINNVTSGDQSEVAVSSLADGGFVIAWKSAGQDGSSGSVVAQRFNAAGAEVGGERVINATTSGDQGGPTVLGLSDGSYVIAWHSDGQDGSGFGVYGSWFDANDQLIVEEIAIPTGTTNFQTYPVLTEVADGFLAVWNSYSQSGDAAWGVYGKKFTISGGGGGVQNTAISWSSAIQPSGSSVAFMYRPQGSSTWTTVNGTHNVNISGLADGNYEYQIHYTDQGEIVKQGNGSFTVNDNSTVNLDTDFDSELLTSTVTTGSSIDDYLQSSDLINLDYVEAVVRNESNVIVSQATTIPESHANYGGEVNLSIGNELAQGNYSVQITLYYLGGATTVKPTFNYSVGEPPVQYIEASDGATNDVLVTQTSDETLSIVNSQTGDTPDITSGSEFRANTLTSGDQRYPSSATLSDGTTIVLWEGYDGAWFGGKMRIYGQHFSADGSKLGSEFIAAQNTSKNLKGVSVTALQGGGFAASWASDDNNTYIKYFNNATTPAATTGELMLHASSAGTSRNNTSIAALSNGNVVAVWQSTSQDGSGVGIYGNVLTASGSFVGSEFRLNTTTSGNQEIPEVAALADGGFIVTWQSANQDGSGLGIYAQRYNAAGFEQGGEFRINNVTSGDQSEVAVSSLADGGFIIAWKSAGQDGSSGSVVAQRFNAAGAEVGGERVINATTSGDQGGPTVLGLSDGSYVIAWHSDGQDDSGFGVFGSWFDANDQLIAAEIAIPTGTTNFQTYPVLTEVADGFLAVWNSYSQSGDAAWGVYGKKFTISGGGGGVQNTAISWSSAIQPSGSSVAFMYRPQGSSTWTTVNGTHNVNISGLADGNYEYQIHYTDQGEIVKQAQGSFSVVDNNTANQTTTFSWDVWQSTPVSGTSLQNFVDSSEFSTLESIVASVETEAGSPVSTATTVIEAHQGYDGDVNLSVGSTLPDGKYVVVLQKTYLSGATAQETIYVQVGSGAVSTTTTSVTDVYGNVVKYAFDERGRIDSVEHVKSGAASQITSYVYDNSDNLTNVMMPGGRIVRYDYDARGNRILEQDANGNTVEWKFNLDNLLTNSISYVDKDPDGAGTQMPIQAQVTRYAYDNKFRLRFVVSAEGRVTEHKYDSTTGNKTSTFVFVDGNDLYDLSSLAATDVLSESALTTWAAQANRLIGERTDYAYNFRGQVETLTQYEKLDSNGLGVMSTASVTRFEYDRYGNLLFSVDPRGELTAAEDFTTYYAYDGMHRMTSSKNALGQETLNFYIDANNQTQIQYENGLIANQFYDASGALTQFEQRGYSNELLSQSTNKYDQLGRLQYTESPDNTRTYQIYDELSRVVGTVDAENHLTQLVYNDNNDVIRTIGYFNQVTNTSALATENVSLATLLPTGDSKDVVSWNVLNKSGQLIYAVDAEGYVSQFFYDGVGQVTDTIAYSEVRYVGTSSSQPTVLDIDDLVTAQADANKYRHARTFYSQDGLVIGQLDALGYLSVFSYNGAGQLVQSNSYATPVSESLRVAGDLPEIEQNILDNIDYDPSETIITRKLYDARGRLTGDIDGESYLTEFLYDVAGQRVEVVRYKSPVTQFGPLIDNVRPSAVDAQHSYSIYDDVGQLVGEVNVFGHLTEFVYDNMGRVTRTIQYKEKANLTGDISQLANVRPQSHNDDRKTETRYDMQGRVTGSMGGEGAAQTGDPVSIWAQYASTNNYDDMGRLINTIDANGRKQLFLYDNVGRLTHTLNVLDGQAEAEVMETDYDGFGRITGSRVFANRLDVTNITGGLLTAAIKIQLQALRNDDQDTVNTFYLNRLSQVFYSTNALGKAKSTAYTAFGEVDSETRSIASGETTITDYSYNQRGDLTDVVSDMGGLNQTTRQEYDAFGRLVKSWDGENNLTQYTYDNLGREIVLSNAKNVAFKTFYDAFSRTTKTIDGNEQETNYVYDIDENSFTINFPLGVSTKTISNAFGEQLQITDAEGNVTTYEYDHDGRLSKTVNAHNDYSENIYDVGGRLELTRDEKGVLTKYEYDVSGRVHRVTSDFGTGKKNVVTETEYDAKGQKVVVREAVGKIEERESLFVYDNAGQLRFVVDPMNYVTESIFDDSGLVLQSIVYKQPMSVTSSAWTPDEFHTALENSGITKSSTYYIYDGLSRLRSTIDPLGYVTQTDYDDANQVVASHRYATSIAGPSELNTIVGTERHSNYFAYDNIGQRTFVMDAMGYVTRFIFDDNGNVTKQAAYETPISSIQNVGTLNGSPSISTHFIYDALNRLTHTVDAEGYVTKNKYNDNGQVEKITRYANVKVVVSNLSDAPTVADLGIIDTPDEDRIDQFYYDALGRVTYKLDAQGYVTQNEYDAVGNVTRSTRFSGKALSWDTLNNGVAVVDVESLVPDGSGIQNGGLVVSHEWSITQGRGYVEFGVPSENANIMVGLNTSATNPNQGTSNQYLDFNHAIYINGTQIMAYGYDDGDDRYQPISGFVHQEGSRYRIEVEGLDVRYQIQAGGSGDWTTMITVQANDPESSYRVNALVPNGRLDNIVVSDDLAGQAQINAYEYDNLGRVEYKTDPDGYIESYTYDAYGNRLTTTIASKGTWSYEYDDRGNLTREETPQVYVFGLNASANSAEPITGLDQTQSYQSIVTTYIYDAFGNMKDMTENAEQSNARTTSYYYDNLGRQKLIVYPGSSVADLSAFENAPVRNEKPAIGSVFLEYDAFGNAVSQVGVDGGVSYNVYDSLNRVLFEIDAERFVTEYVYDAFGNQQQVVRYDKAMDLSAYTFDNPPGESNVRSWIGTTTFGDNRVLTKVYDDLNRLTDQFSESAHQYDMGQGLNPVEYTGQRVEKLSYNAFGDVLNTQHQAGQNRFEGEFHYYDTAGQKIATVSGEGYLKEFRYDAFGHVVEQRDYANQLSQGSWNEFGYVVPDVSTDFYLEKGADRVTRYTYDGRGNKRSETQADVLYGVLIEDGNGNIVLPWVEQDSVTTRYEYDEVGNLTKAIDADGNVVETVYDAIGNVLGVIEPAREVPVGDVMPFMPAVGFVNGSVTTSTSSMQYADFNGIQVTVTDSLKVNLLMTHSQQNILTLSETNVFAVTMKVKDQNSGLISPISTRFLLGSSSGTNLTSIPFDMTNAFVEYFGGNPLQVPLVSIEDVSIDLLFGNQMVRFIDNINTDKNEIMFRKPALTSNAELKFRFKETSSQTWIEATLANGLLKQSGDFMRIDAQSYPFGLYDYEMIIEKNGELYSTGKGQLVIKGYNATVEPTSIYEEYTMGGTWRMGIKNLPSVAEKVIMSYRLVGASGPFIEKQLYKKADGHFHVDYDDMMPGRYEFLLRIYDTNDNDVEMASYTLKGDESKGNGYLDGTTRLTKGYQSIPTVALEQGTMMIQPFTFYARDAYSNIVHQTKFANGISGGSIVESPDDQHLFYVYDIAGRVLRAQDGEGKSSYYSYDIAGRIAKAWASYEDIDNLTNATHHRVFNYEYDALGREINKTTYLESPRLDADKNAQTEINELTHYNAFGEVDKKGINEFQTVYEYDDLGRIWRTNEGGVTKVNLYDARDRVTAEITSGTIDLSTYNNAASVAGLESNIRRTRYKYDADGNVTEKWLPARASSSNPSDTDKITQAFDHWGNVISVSDARGNGWITNFRYDHNNNQIVEEKPESRVWYEQGYSSEGYDPRLKTETRYDKMGRAIAKIDARNNWESIIYDDAGQAIAQVHKDNSRKTVRFDAFGREVARIDENGYLTEKVYDRKNQLKTVINPHTTETYTYDAIGNRISMADGLNHTTKYKYDVQGNVIEERTPMGYATLAQFDIYGNKVWERDANTNTQTWQYSAHGQLKNTKGLDDIVTTYVYDFQGNLDFESNARGRSVDYTYFSNGMLRDVRHRVDDGLAGTTPVYQDTHYEYDEAGNRVKELIEQGGNTLVDTTIAYDSYGRIASIDGKKNDITYGYDENGNRRFITTTFWTGDTTAYKTETYWFKYDDMNRATIAYGYLDAPNQEIKIIDDQGVEFGYDAAGNRRTEKRQSGSNVEYKSFTYDGNNRLKTYSINGNISREQFYDAGGRLETAVDYGDGANPSYVMLTTYSYNANDWVTLESTSKNNVGYSKVQYGGYNGIASGYDAVGNVKFYRTHEAEYVNEYKPMGNTYKIETSSGQWSHGSGVLTNYYDVNGNVYESNDILASTRYKQFVYDFQGKTLFKIQASSKQALTQAEQSAYQYEQGISTAYGQALDNPVIQLYYFANNEYLGTSGQIDETDFKVLKGLNVNALSKTTGHYLVRAGDTLQGIAIQVYGDSDKWYLIADRNGIPGNDLSGFVGKDLIIPDQITRNVNDASAFKAYNPGEIVGSAMPTLPPPSAECNIIAMIIVVIITVIVAVYAGPAVAKFVEGALTGALGATMAGAVGAAAGAAVVAVASQLAQIATGLREEFDWGQVAIAAVSAGITTGIFGDVTKLAPGDLIKIGAAMTQNALSQGISMKLDRQEKFNWGAVAAAGFSSTKLSKDIGDQVNQSFGGGLGILDTLPSEVFNSTVGTMLRVAGSGGSLGKQEWAQIAADAFGNMLGNAIVENSVGSTRAQNELQQALAEDLSFLGETSPSRAPLPQGGLFGQRPQDQAPGVALTLDQLKQAIDVSDLDIAAHPELQLDLYNRYAQRFGMLSDSVLGNQFANIPQYGMVQRAALGQSDNPADWAAMLTNIGQSVQLERWMMAGMPVNPMTGAHNANPDTLDRIVDYMKNQSLTPIQDANDPNVLHVQLPFDGTWVDADNLYDGQGLTNVSYLSESFDGFHGTYIEGVGTDWYTKQLGGGTGAGMGNRVERAMQYVQDMVAQNPDKQIVLHLVGFSRGAATARAFANVLADSVANAGGQVTVPFMAGALYDVPAEMANVRIGSMVLFDTVASVGIPGNNINLGYDLSIPSMVENVLHIVARDENRDYFPGTSIVNLNNLNDPSRIEVVMPGVHSDIGGGYVDNNNLSRYPLTVAHDYLTRLGVPMKPLNPNWLPDPILPLTIHDSRYTYPDKISNYLGSPPTRTIYGPK